jgi:hypothetical protein
MARTPDNVMRIPLTPKPFRPRIVFSQLPEVSRERPNLLANTPDTKFTLLKKRSFNEFMNGITNIPIHTEPKVFATPIQTEPKVLATPIQTEPKVLATPIQTEPKVFAKQEAKEELWKDEIPVSEIQDQVVRGLIPVDIS